MKFFPAAGARQGWRLHEYRKRVRHWRWVAEVPARQPSVVHRETRRRQQLQFQRRGGKFTREQEGAIGGGSSGWNPVSAEPRCAAHTGTPRRVSHYKVIGKGYVHYELPLGVQSPTRDSAGSLQRQGKCQCLARHLARVDSALYLYFSSASTAQNGRFAQSAQDVFVALGRWEAMICSRVISSRKTWAMLSTLDCSGRL